MFSVFSSKSELLGTQTYKNECKKRLHSKDEIVTEKRYFPENGNIFNWWWVSYRNFRWRMLVTIPLPSTLMTYFRATSEECPNKTWMPFRTLFSCQRCWSRSGKDIGDGWNHSNDCLGVERKRLSICHLAFDPSWASCCCITKWGYFALYWHEFRRPNLYLSKIWKNTL